MVGKNLIVVSAFFVVSFIVLVVCTSFIVIGIVILIASVVVISVVGFFSTLNVGIGLRVVLTVVVVDCVVADVNSFE